MLNGLSIKALITAVMIAILALVAAAAAFVIGSMTREALAMIIAAFLIGLALAVLVYRRIAQMVAAAEDFSARIERGDFAAFFAASAFGEEEALTAAVNRMVDCLRAAAKNEAATRQRLAFLVGATPAVIYSAKAGGDYGATFISPNVVRQLGWTAEDFINDSGFWSSHIHPGDRDRVIAQQADLFTAGRIEAEYRFQHKDGSWRWMHDETVLVRDESGAPEEIAGSWLDITQRRELEVSLKRRDEILNAVAYGATRFLRAGEEASAAQWQLAVEAVLSHIGEATGVSRIWVAENTGTPDGDMTIHPVHRWVRHEFAVADTDPVFSGDVSYQRDGLGVEALRLRRGELLQVRPQDLPAPVRSRLERLGIRSQMLAPIMAGNDWWGVMAFDDCVNEQSWPELEQEALRAAASLFGAATAARTGREALRASLETLGSVLEKLKRQSAEIERQNVELVRASRMKSEFLAAITHELKTPLNAILGFSDMLDAGLAGELNQQQREYAGDILGAAKELHELVNRLLDLAQIDAGKKPFMPEETDLGALLHEAADMHAAAAKARGITVTVEADEVMASVDVHLLRHLLKELIGNAIKFNRDGGTVTLRASVEITSDLAAAVSQPSRMAITNDLAVVSGQPSQMASSYTSSSIKEQVIIEIIDSGIGIAAADQAHLFEPFVQIDATLGRKYGGTGLGLALAQRIAEMHGGGITVDSAPGQGSRFTVRLPRRLEKNINVFAAGEQGVCIHVGWAKP